MRGVAFFALFASGCFSPSYENGKLQCAASPPQCPKGFYCAEDSRCWRNDTYPDLAGADLTYVDLAGADLAGLDFSEPPQDLLTLDAPPQRFDGNFVLRVGGLGTVGPAAAGAAYKLRDDGFESGGRACAGALCVTGGITP